MTRGEILDYRVELRILNIGDAVSAYNKSIVKRGAFINEILDVAERDGILDEINEVNQYTISTIVDHVVESYRRDDECDGTDKVKEFFDKYKEWFERPEESQALSELNFKYGNGHGDFKNYESCYLFDLGESSDEHSKIYGNLMAHIINMDDPVMFEYRPIYFGGKLEVLPTASVASTRSWLREFHDNHGYPGGIFDPDIPQDAQDQAAEEDLDQENLNQDNLDQENLDQENIAQEDLDQEE